MGADGLELANSHATTATVLSVLTSFIALEMFEMSADGAFPASVTSHVTLALPGDPSHARTNFRELRQCPRFCVNARVNKNLVWHILKPPPYMSQVPIEAKAAVPSSARSSQWLTEPGALMRTKGGSGLDGEYTGTHLEDDVRNAPICNRSHRRKKRKRRGHSVAIR